MRILSVFLCFDKNQTSDKSECVFAEHQTTGSEVSNPQGEEVKRDVTEFHVYYSEIKLIAITFVKLTPIIELCKSIVTPLSLRTVSNWSVKHDVHQETQSECVQQ